ncbi:NAD-dependent succinate-semialdehyde dehydrogenase [Denitratisoma oestradiolicum]|uniref:Succinate-semialdehyde dehydrogenase I, NADP-dependent n=2 Tax=Denitratisoma oestradiolicum TaxID=311182 RepID=A0A6S6XVL2_9PROT|nr:NAD-dependent succinate-semialdehyde dehydrogenase [Denitratisoma oestradiolicum]TWO79248.1 succinate-semialdehyde dehydrogenase (NADP(+)) [Denitratisoma oestradiolicum]CAB1368253.1 succinate-semialdehyde dehydrogenase I, NADP-dependent [Denitratisoma oestradiolicum]
MQLHDRSLMKSMAYIGGNWVSAEEGITHAVFNPSTGKEIARVPDLGAKETERAIAAAQTSLPGWREKTAKERSRLLRCWHDLIMANQDDLARIMTFEQGKPLAEARSEVAYGASFIEWFAEEGKRVYGEIIPSPTSDKRLFVTKQAIGVTAAITPWNFPIAMITRKVAPALAAGCTSVVKPAEATPLSALALAELASRAGIPPGVLNIVTTSRPSVVGDVLTTHPSVKKLSFTGSTRVGKILMAQCASTVKRVSLELGGNAPFIVFDDADLDAAIRGALASKYRNAGQTCVCANRFLVQDGIYDAFAAKLSAAVADMKVDDGFTPGAQIGPLINKAAIDKVHHLVADALAKGAKVLTGGRRHEKGGNFYTPTVLTDVTTGMDIAREEIFGPIAPLFRFKSDAEAIQLANDTAYGLASYFYSRDINRIWRVAEQLEYGMVGVNEGMISNEVAPFGGIKESGIGREGSHHGIDEYLQIKYICMGGM